jgi:2-amino-4-hydroxy-6-hydroxymethyldihydropteridine diphosphokinase
MAEVTAPLADHEIHRGAEATPGIQRRDWLLQNKIRSHLEGLLRTCVAVQDGKSYGALVTIALSQTLEHGKGAFKVVTIYNDGIKLLGTHDFMARVDPAADFDVNGELLQNGLEDADNLGIPAEKERFQAHRRFIVAFQSEQAKVTKVTRGIRWMTARMPILRSRGRAFAGRKLETENQSSMHYQVYLSLGSNVGDRAANLNTAIHRLASLGEVVATSSFYETEPVELADQPWFLNCVVQLETEKMPGHLLNAVLAIEREMGRRRQQKKGPRNIDIDILLFGNLVIDAKGLCIPHPAMHERRFVLEPLAEIAPETRHPILNRTVRELRDALPTGQTVRRAPDLGHRTSDPGLRPPSHAGKQERGAGREQKKSE